MLEVRSVLSKRDFGRFIDYPYTRNHHNPHWIPPLRLSEKERLQPAKNPFFAHADHDLLLAWRHDVVVGRIAVFSDHLHNQVHKDNIASFGFFEAEDEASTRALFDAAEAWGRARGRAHMRGPLNPSLNESAGLLVEGFDIDPMLLMPYNPPEYAAFIEAAGYRKIKDLYGWRYDLTRPFDAALDALAERVRARHRLVLRSITREEFGREVERLRILYCGAWERNWGFVPPTKEEFQRIANELKPIYDPVATLVAEADGEMVACAVAIPDINQVLKGTNGRLFPTGLVRLLMRRRIMNQGRLLLLGVLPKYRASGLYLLLVYQLLKQVRHTKYRQVELSWILEDNHNINQPLERNGVKRCLTYRIYQKALA